MPNDDLTKGVVRNEVGLLKSNVITNEESLKWYGHVLTTEMDGIPEDVWMCLGEEWFDMLSI